MIHTIHVDKLQSECTATFKGTGHFSGTRARAIRAVGFERPVIVRGVVLLPLDLYFDSAQGMVPHDVVHES